MLAGPRYRHVCLWKKQNLNATVTDDECTIKKRRGYRACTPQVIGAVSDKNLDLGLHACRKELPRIGVAWRLNAWTEFKND
jgi:hypothetical protein